MNKSSKILYEKVTHKETYGIGNRSYLVKTMMEQLDITEEEVMETPTKDFVKLVREKKLDKLI